MRAHSEAYREREMDNRRLRKEARLFRSSVTPVHIDAQGRAVIPKRVRDRYRLTSRVMLVGSEGRLEIYPLDQWQRFAERAETELPWDAD